MDVKFIEGLIALFERSGLAELEYQESGARIRLTAARSDAGGPGIISVETSSVPVAASTPAIPAAAGPVRRYVKSGLSGVIYMASAPNMPPFVGVGDAVDEGQTLGIVEAMKMLSPIESEWSGRVAEICVTDGTPVEAGATLFVIEVEA